MSRFCLISHCLGSKLVTCIYFIDWWSAMLNKWFEIETSALLFFVNFFTFVLTWVTCWKLLILYKWTFKSFSRFVLDFFRYKRFSIYYDCTSQIRVSTASPSPLSSPSLSSSSPHSFICHTVKGFRHEKRLWIPLTFIMKSESLCVKVKVISGVFIYLIKPLTPKVAFLTVMRINNYKLVIT